MDDTRENANAAAASVVMDRLEDILRQSFLEQEKKWDDQDIRRHELRTKHKEHALKRLDLQRRSGQAYTMEQVELATAPATSQCMLPTIVRRSIRNGEYAFHGKNCSVQELRHCPCKFSTRMIEEARECTHKPVQTWKPGRQGTGSGSLHSFQGLQCSLNGRKPSLNIDGCSAEKISAAKDTKKSQKRPAFTNLVFAKEKPLEAGPDYSLASITQLSSPKVEMLSGLSTQCFDPNEMQVLIEAEKSSGEGQKLEDSIAFKSTLESGGFTLDRSISVGGVTAPVVVHDMQVYDTDEVEKPPKMMPISFFDCSATTPALVLSTDSQHSTDVHLYGPLPSSRDGDITNDSTMPAPVVSAFTFHENYEHHKNPYLVTYVPASGNSLSYGSLSRSSILPRFATTGAHGTRWMGASQSIPSETQNVTMASLPQVLRCNRFVQKVEPLGLAKIAPVAFVSDATKTLTEDFHYPFKRTRKEKSQQLHVQFAEQTLFKIGMNDERIAETCDSDSEDYVICKKPNASMHHKQLDSSGNCPDSLANTTTSFSYVSSAGSGSSQGGLLDAASTNISLIHKEQGAGAKGSSFIDSPSALIRDFEERHRSRAVYKANNI